VAAFGRKLTFNLAGFWLPERPVLSADSIDRRNTLAKSFGWCFKV
jgi:hypothetical protein